MLLHSVSSARAIVGSNRCAGTTARTQQIAPSTFEIPCTRGFVHSKSLRRTVFSVRHSRILLSLSGVLLFLATLAGSVAASSARAAATPALSVQQLRVPVGVSVAQLTSISCANVESCAAGGLGIDEGMTRAMMVSETRGVWSSIGDVGPKTSGGSEITAVACPAPGSCVAVGNDYSTTNTTTLRHSSSFIITQDGSGWSSPQTIPLSGPMPHSDYAVSNLQCPSKNDCVIIGLDDVSQISQVKYAQTWQNGKWGAPHFFSQSQLGKGFATMIFDALSCPSTTWCFGAGQFEASSGRSSPFGVTMHNGEWSHLTLLEGLPRIHQQQWTELDFVRFDRQLRCDRSQPVRYGQRGQRAPDHVGVWWQMGATLDVVNSRRDVATTRSNAGPPRLVRA